MGYTTQLVHPGSSFVNSDSAAFEIATTIGADLFGAIFLAGMVLAQFTSGLAAQASASRLLFAMGRDAVLPPKLFGALHSRFHTPVFNIVLTGAIGIIALFLDVLSAASFINFGAFIAFTMVNLSVIFLVSKDADAKRQYGVIKGMLVPLIGAMVNLWLMSKLDINAFILGLIWLSIGLAQLAYLTRFFRQEPPEVAFDDSEPESAPASVKAPL